MSSRGGLTPLLAVAGTLLIGTAIYLHWPRTRGGDVDAGEHVTIRLYKDPTPVAAFTAKDLDGRPISSAAFRGKVILVNFWATWCPPCRAEIPDLVALQDKYRDHLQIIGVSEDDAPVEEVRQFVAEHHINYPVVMSTAELSKLFPNVQALPTTFVLDPQSNLVQKHAGMLNPRTTELETRVLAGLSANASIERVDRAEKLKLENGAQLMEIPGVDLAKLPSSKRSVALQKLNAEPCSCGCDLTVAKCRVDDPSCGVSLPLARRIVDQIADSR